MTKITYWIDGEPGVLMFKAAAAADKHVDMMIETFGPLRFVLDRTIELPSGGKRRAAGRSRGAGASSQSPRFLGSDL